MPLIDSGKKSCNSVDEDGNDNVLNLGNLFHPAFEKRSKTGFSIPLRNFTHR
jgi:hypothetical protein